jgi:hypothetical protein
MKTLISCYTLNQTEVAGDGSFYNSCTSREWKIFYQAAGPLITLVARIVFF